MVRDEGEVLKAYSAVRIHLFEFINEAVVGGELLTGVAPVFR